MKTVHNYRAYKTVKMFALGQEHDAKVMDVDVALATIGPTLCSGATWAQSRDFPCFSHYSSVYYMVQLWTQRNRHLHLDSVSPVPL